MQVNAFVFKKCLIIIYFLNKKPLNRAIFESYLIILHKSYKVFLDKLCIMHYNKDRKGKGSRKND